ncbi:hypothetical protein CesoFtcFv8_001571 [Champsocephalus esox]|uniref:Selenoprotein S n=1 Tax=Champsocephalus esox TaxID=159716 RepID=A0AAN8D4X3_9TELE|nr:hypothetical protein CesoFtcFv8_001571 [Champsocephalus esox]
MDDVEVSDGDSPYTVEKAPLRNPDMTPLSMNVGELLSLYGWYLLFGTLLVYLLLQYLSRRRSSQRSPPPPTPQDVALVARRQEAMEAARMKMQEELDAKASIFREKQKQQEEEKRRQKIEIWDSMQTGKELQGNSHTFSAPCRGQLLRCSQTKAGQEVPPQCRLQSPEWTGGGLLHL